MQNLPLLFVTSVPRGTEKRSQRDRELDQAAQRSHTAKVIHGKRRSQDQGKTQDMCSPALEKYSSLSSLEELGERKETQECGIHSTAKRFGYESPFLPWLSNKFGSESEETPSPLLYKGSSDRK
jgi:hypothetical protein